MIRIDIILTVFVWVVLEGILASDGGEWHWGYETEAAPNYWLLHYDHCGEKAQSPIDLPLSETHFDSSLEPIKFNKYDADDKGVYKLLNNGHTAHVDILGGEQTLSGGLLPARYKLAQFHFHWGTNNKLGSEHLINGLQYPLEMHLVHYDEQYSGVGEAKDHKDGVAVIGVMFQIGKQEHEGLSNVVNHLPDIKYKDQEQTIPTFPLDVLLPEDPDKYFRYSGSLTTPPCSESVVWTVLNNPVTISQAQIDKFRELSVNEEGHEVHNLLDNFRPPQPLFGRTIYTSFKTAAPQATNDQTSYKYNTSLSTKWLLLAASLLCLIQSLI